MNHSLERVLLKCSKVAARAANEQEALQSACDVLVESGRFRGASIGFHQAGKHQGSKSNQCFLLRVDGQDLGALTLSCADPDAFEPTLVEQVGDWCEGFAPLIAAARRRALHGRSNAWQAAGSDVEELRRTEAALRRSEAFLAKAQSLSSTGSFGWTASTNGMVWSEQTFRVFGYERAGVTPTWEQIFQRLHREDLPGAHAMVEGARRDGADFEGEFRLVMADGARKHVRIVAQAIGCPMTGEFVGAVMDITAAKEMAQALAFRDQVMAILGHDLRNPLSGVLGIVGLAGLDKELPGKTREMMAQIGKAAGRMREMIETLLDFTQTQFAGKLPISRSAIDLRELCAQVVEELTAGHPRRTIAVEAHGDATGRWDAGRVAQVVSNLLGNALTHGDPVAPVRLSIESDRHSVALKVHNQGPAIEREQIPVLFEPFRRGAHAGDGAASRGLGLGLHIARQIVTAHGGSISVQSTATEGTTFCVALPRG
jgi:signal transduction histidine kinase